MIEKLNASCGDSSLFLVGDEGLFSNYKHLILDKLEPAISVYCIDIPNLSKFRTLHGFSSKAKEFISEKCSSADSVVQIVGLDSYATIAYDIMVCCFSFNINVNFFALVNPVFPEGHLGQVDNQLFFNLQKNYDFFPTGVDVHLFVDRHQDNKMTTQLEKISACAHLQSHQVSQASSLGESISHVLFNITRLRTTKKNTIKHNSAVAIQSKNNQLDPYVCFPGAGAGVFDFVHFASALKSNNTVLGMQARGMCGQKIPFGGVEVAAETYLKEIEHRYSDRPIHLVGHSFGGWIAFEVALQMQKRGKTIRSLTLLDSEMPLASSRVGHEYTDAEALMLLISLYEQALEKSLNLNIELFDGVEPDEQIRILNDSLVKAGLLPRTSLPKQLQGSVRSFKSAVRTVYKPSDKYHGPVFLVLARNLKESQGEAVFRANNIAHSWRNLAPNLDFHLSDGNHVTLLKAPHISKIVEKVEKNQKAEKKLDLAERKSLSVNV